MTRSCSLFLFFGLIIIALFPNIAHGRSDFLDEQELSTGVTVSQPIVLSFLEYGFGPFAVAGGASYCINAIEEQPFGFSASAKVYIIPGYLYIKTGYGIAGVETGGSFGSLNHPIYGAEVLGGARILAGEESPYLFLAVEAGASVRTGKVRQTEIITDPAMIMPKIGIALGFSFLRDFN